MKASIAKHVEYNNIYVTFSDDFKLINIPKDVLASMLDNIENRI